MPGKTFVVYKVSTREPEDTKKLVLELKNLKNAQVKDIKTEPIGFGIEIIKVGVLVDEKNQEAIENTLNEIKANKLVSEAEIDSMTLI